MFLLEKQHRENYPHLHISKIRHKDVQKIIKRSVSPKRRFAEKWQIQKEIPLREATIVCLEY
jgi:hypothetical protein